MCNKFFLFQPPIARAGKYENIIAELNALVRLGEYGEVRYAYR
jgi:hypothetical protein